MGRASFKEGKPGGFHYNEHRMMDSKNNIIVGTHVTAGNIHDMILLPEILQEVESRPGRKSEYLGLNERSGYRIARFFCM